MGYLEELQKTTNRAYTENGGATNKSSLNPCLDFFANGADETAFENARRKWAAAGFDLPTVVFWNVESRSNNTPATKFDTNVALISGSSQSAFRLAFEGKTPLDLMHEVIDSERYQAIKA